MPIATLEFTDGVVHEISVAPGQTLLDAAIQSGAPIRHQCQSGSCLSCLCVTHSGGLNMRPGVATSLLPSDIASGQRLACTAILERDDRIVFDYDSNPKAARTVNAFINTVERVCDDVVYLEVELAEGDWLPFDPGQYVNITVPGMEVSRSYSMANNPNQLPVLSFYIRLVDGGLMSEYLSQRAKVDDVLQLNGPHGRFVLEADPDDNVVFIAGGTGLAPVLSLISQAKARKGRKPKMTLYFGCATSVRLFADDDLELLGEMTPTLDVVIGVEDGSHEHYPSLNPVQLIDEERINDKTRVYMCGPPGMINAAHTRLTDLGLASDRIHYEKFTASE